jgi:hypothetical protein
MLDTIGIMIVLGAIAILVGVSLAYVIGDM